MRKIEFALRCLLALVVTFALGLLFELGLEFIIELADDVERSY